MGKELWQLSAVEAVDLLRTGKVTPLELVEAAHDRWKAVDSKVNAMPIAVWDAARARARQLMEAGHPADPPPGYLYGLPITVKDSMAVKGQPFVLGSKLYKDRVSRDDDPLVEVLVSKGAVVIGKTNVPELCMGGHTYNDVYGATRNPWDPERSAGGSSGGAAAALAAGVGWGAAGSDLAGSLRMPAAFCGCAALRPSAGRVPQRRAGGAPARPAGGAAGGTAAGGAGAAGCAAGGAGGAAGGAAGPAPSAAAGEPCDKEVPEEAYLELWRYPMVQGPMARCVADVALLMDAMAEAHPGDPLSLPRPQQRFSDAIRPGALPPPRRVAWSPDLGGAAAVDSAVAAACEAAAAWFGAPPSGGGGGGLGARVVRDCPDLSCSEQIHDVLRALAFRRLVRPMRDPKRAPLLGRELRFQLERSAALTHEEVEDAVWRHDDMLAGVERFFQEYDLLVCPAAPCVAFDPSGGNWPGALGGKRIDTYMDWLGLAYAVTLMGCPSAVVMCGLLPPPEARPSRHRHGGSFAAENPHEALAARAGPGSLTGSFLQSVSSWSKACRRQRSEGDAPWGRGSASAWRGGGSPGASRRGGGSGRGGRRLPVAIQIVGAPGKDAEVLAAAAAFEAAHPFAAATLPRCCAADAAACACGAPGCASAAGIRTPPPLPPRRVAAPEVARARSGRSAAPWDAEAGPAAGASLRAALGAGVGGLVKGLSRLAGRARPVHPEGAPPPLRFPSLAAASLAASSATGGGPPAAAARSMVFALPRMPNVEELVLLRDPTGAIAHFGATGGREAAPHVAEALDAELARYARMALGAPEGGGGPAPRGAGAVAEEGGMAGGSACSGGSDYGEQGGGGGGGGGEAASAAAAGRRGEAARRGGALSGLVARLVRR